MPKFAVKACSFFLNISLMEIKSAKTKLVQNIGSPFKRDVGDCVHGVKSDIELVGLNLNQSHCGFIPPRPWTFLLVFTHGSALRWLIRWHRDTDTMCLALFKECPDLMFQIYWNQNTEIMAVSSKIAYIVAPGEAQKESKQAWRTDWTDTLEQWCSSQWLMKAKKIEASSMLKALPNDWVIKLREALAWGRRTVGEVSQPIISLIIFGTFLVKSLGSYLGNGGLRVWWRSTTSGCSILQRGESQKG